MSGTTSPVTTEVVNEQVQTVIDQMRVLVDDRALSEKQVNQVRDLVTEAVREAGPLDRKWTPETRGDDHLLDGTVYGRLGMNIGQVELVHDVMNASTVVDHRLRGPNEKTRALVEAARKSRAMDTQESGFGAQLVPDAMYVPQIWEAAREKYGMLAGLVESRTMTGPVEKQPVLGNVPDMIFVGENPNAIASTTEYGTQKVASQEVTLTAQKFLAHYNYSGEMVEDSIVPFVGLLERGFAITQGRTLDKILLNGDDTNAATGNINLVDADPADTLYYLGMDGVRHAALVDNTANATDHGGAALTWRALMKLPTLMLDRTRDAHWGRPNTPEEIIYVGTPELDDDLLALDEVVIAATENLVLPGFTPIGSELTRIGKYPYVSTASMQLTDATGKVSTTSGNNTKGQVVLFNRNGLLWGVRRQAQVEVERRPGTDQWRLILSTRVALGRYSPTGAASGIEWAACLYNIGNN